VLPIFCDPGGGGKHKEAAQTSAFAPRGQICTVTLGAGFGFMLARQGQWAQGGLSISSESFAMIRPAFVGALVTVVAVVTASAEDFPLAFRTILAQDVMSFPGGSGSYGQMRLTKPTSLRKEPNTMSRHPLYGECDGTGKRDGFIFRLDESKGEGRGYDRLIIDMNQNGDLTDDPVAQSAALPTDRRAAMPDQFLFGPIQAPADKAVAGGRPVYFALAYIFNRGLLSSSRQAPNLFLGQLMLKPGWYLDATAKLDGRELKVGVLDGDSNLHLGDVSQPLMVTNRAERTWYFRFGDYLLVDADGSGAFKNDVFQSEACPFGPILHIGSKAYSVGLTSDCKSLRVEPWPEPLAEVALQPRGQQVRAITLAWERPGGKWQIIRPAVANGRVMVPPGNYRLYSCNLAGSSGDQVMVSGTQRFPQRPVAIAVGKANALDCGGPLQIKVTANRAGASSRGLLAEDSGYTSLGSGSMLHINATVVGAGGEIYTTFLGGERLRSKPPKPTFSIVQTGGKTVAAGNLEYG
jgi:hypothetical protein